MKTKPKKEAILNTDHYVKRGKAMDSVFHQQIESQLLK